MEAEQKKKETTEDTVTENAEASSEEPVPGSGTKRKARQAEVVEPRTPLKRQRVPVSRFQSPLEDLEPKFKIEKEDKKKDVNITLYKKGSFLAVRGAEGSFYLCRTAQNIYSKSKRLRIQWLSLEKQPNIYKFDYVDSTEMETVLTEITMDKVSKDSYKLPSNEQKRVEKILDRAIRVEKGIATADEVEEEAMEDRKEEDEADSSDEEEDTPPPKPSRSRQRVVEKGKKSKSTIAKKKEEPKGKEKASKQKGSKKTTKEKVKKERKRGPDANLKPNQKIKVLEKDPFFEAKDKVVKPSALVNTKQAFKYVNLADLEGLKQLLAQTSNITNFNLCRSIGDSRTPLDLAVQKGDANLVNPLVEEVFTSPVKRTPPPEPIISSTCTGSYNPMYLGIGRIRDLNVSRGSKEGNDAFSKESISTDCAATAMKKWMSWGIPVDNMEVFLLAYSSARKSTRSDVVTLVISQIEAAIRNGHRHLAAKYVADAEQLGGYGFNFLHKEVLNFENEDLRDIILAASVRKKPFSADAITPLHCAAINPNVKYLTRLLSIEPDLNILTKSKARPIHFAAACEDTGPLEFLLQRKASPNEADSQGEIPIHFAAQSGRAKSIEVLIKHAKSQAQDVPPNPKWGLGCVNRGNRFARCPLHLAVENNHLEAVRALIKHGADVSKPLAAGSNKVTPLMLAAQRGNLTIVRELIQSGAAVEMLDKLKRSALTHAIINGNANVASYLLFLGANPNRVDSSNNSLVHYAAAYGWEFCLKLLVKDAGALPDTCNDWKTTPISIAFLKGHYSLVEYLSNQKGVDINFKNDDGLTLVSIACRSRLLEGLEGQVKYLIELCEADPTIQDLKGYNALHHLANNNVKTGHSWGYSRTQEVCPELMKISVNIAMVLIEAGCDPTKETKDGKTPITLAIEQVNIDLVKFLVAKGGTVSADKNSDEKTVLHLMAEQCYTANLTPMIQILAEHKPKESISQLVEDKPKENGKVNAEKLPAKEGEPDAKAEEPMEVDQVNAVKNADKEKDRSEAAHNMNGQAADQPAQVNSVQDGDTGKEDAKPEEEPASGKEKPVSQFSQADMLKAMARTPDFTGFTPLLRACNVYQQSLSGCKAEQNKWALTFIEALIKWTEPDINQVVGPKNMPDEKEPHYTPEGKCSALHFMVKCDTTGITAGMKLILGANPDLNQRDLKDKTPLVLAIENSDQNAVQALLEQGSDPNILIKEPNTVVTPLVLAAERGHFPIMKLLIQHKANVMSTRSDNLRTPIHILAQNRAREDETIAIIQMLLEHGAAINALDKEEDTPLHLAIMSNAGHSNSSTSLEEFLLERGADVFAKNNKQMMPLHAALNKDGIDPIELCSLLTSVMRDQRVDEPTNKKYTPLLLAAASGATICCMHLLQRRANLEAKEFRGNTPLNMAILGGFDSCAIMLMQRPASASNPIVLSLHEIVQPEQKEEKKRKRPLLTWRPKQKWHDLQPKEFPGKSITLFEAAVSKDLTGVAHMLLDAQGVPMDAIESALNLNKFHLALRLLRRIPDASRLHAKNKEGQNLFHVLAVKTHSHLADLQIKVAGALLEKGVPLGERDNHGLTPLMYAALHHQSMELANFLITNDLRFDPNVRDKFGRDAVAGFMWDYQLVSDQFKTKQVSDFLDVLITKGRLNLDTLYHYQLPDPLLLGATVSSKTPDYFKTDGDYKTSPLIAAIRNYDLGLTRFMLHRGASVDFADSNGMTPMMHAVKMNDVNMVKLLLDPNFKTNAEIAAEPSKDAPGLRKQLSREVFTVNFEYSKEKNPDDVIDEEEGENDEEAVSLSKHTEENEDSVVEEDEEEEEMVDEDPGEEDMEEDEIYESDVDSEGGDTDVVSEGEEEEKEEPAETPIGVTQLNLSRHMSLSAKPKAYTSVQKASNINLSLVDKNRWTSLHHAVRPLEYATFDNDEIVTLLLDAGIPTDAKTKEGKTALDMAVKNCARSIVEVLTARRPDKDAQKPAEQICPFTVEETAPGKVKPSFEEDAETMLKQFDGESKAKPDTDNGPTVDTNCQYRDSGEVASHETTNIPYSVTLSKVDVTCGSYGMYNFYKLQIVKHLAKNIYILFTRWGRIGDRGQFQHTPFNTLKEAAKEFCKIYRSKTGNDWMQSTKFINRPKKYRLMPVLEKKPKQSVVDIKVESEVPSKLSEPISDVITEISNVSMFEASVKKAGIDEDYMPFGRMNKESLLEARKLLADIGEKVSNLKYLSTPAGIEEYQANAEELAKLTNEYYHLVPISGFEHESICPISRKQTVKEHARILADLMDVQIANTILLGATLKRNETNPLDYIYSSLGCKMQPLGENDSETQLILTNVHASVPHATINRVFRISREGEDERLAQTNLPNHRLLWHGSSMSNFISILSRGLLVAPPEVPFTGHAFGEGLYFADTFLKSSHYCHNHSPKSSTKLMLLCEVALGNPKVDVGHSEEDHLDDDINSLKILGQTAPVEDFDAVMPFGASLCLGQLEKKLYKPQARIQHNEYIVHNANQVALRYLVLFNG